MGQSVSVGNEPAAVQVDSCLITTENDAIECILGPMGQVRSLQSTRGNALLFASGDSWTPQHLSLAWPTTRPIRLVFVVKPGYGNFKLVTALDSQPAVSQDQEASVNRSATDPNRFVFELDRPPLPKDEPGHVLSCSLVGQEGHLALSFSLWLNAPVKKDLQSPSFDYNAAIRPSPSTTAPFPLVSHSYPETLGIASNGASQHRHLRAASWGGSPKAVDIPDDSPLVRATLDELERKAVSFRKALKALLKAATRHLDHLKEAEDVQKDLQNALGEVSAQDSLRPLMEIYLGPAARLQSQLTHRSLGVTEELLVVPLRTAIAHLKELAATRKAYLQEATIYNEHLGRYLAMSPGGDQGALTKADDKHRAAKQRFAAAQLASQQNLKEFSLMQIDVLAFLTKWAEASELLATSLVEARSPTSQNLSAFARLQVADLCESARKERETLQAQYGLVGLAPPLERDRSRRRSFGLHIASSSMTPSPSRTSLSVEQPLVGHFTNPDPPERRREGYLYVASKPSNNHRSEASVNSSWTRVWVVLNQGQLIEFKNPAVDGQMNTSSPPINLKYACVKNGLPSDRRFTFEVVTTQSRRVYQADSETEADRWKTTIQMQIEALLNGSSSMRTFDATRFQTFTKGSSPSEHGEKIPSVVHTSSNISSPKTLFSGLVRRASGAHKRKGSSANILQKGFNKRNSTTGLDLGRLPEAASSQLSVAVTPDTSSSSPESTPAIKAPLRLPPKGSPRPSDLPELWTSDDHEIANAVLAMSLPSPQANLSLESESPRQQLLKLIAQPGNGSCQECGKSPATWASYNIGIFLCLQCAGLHRGLGSHISKVRSVDLDEWSPAQLDGLKQGGNNKAKAFWEARRATNDNSDKSDLGAFVRMKYVERKWIGDEQGL